ncbi:MAG: hypothetical protein BWY91_01241 [bacterium ADurb.BinA028]|nr:MAG: hypothetical protein BWY91_01241 [bacterium ADurb.BinA028]
MSEMTISNDFRAACEREFEEIRVKLDRLDEAIRGNGKPGITLRLDRLEQDAKRLSRLVWMVVGSAVTAFASVLVAWITG